LNHAPVFFLRHRYGFARRAAGNEQLHPVCDLIFDERAQTLFINRAVSLEGRD
jgi:hypothetical protein